MAGAQVGGRHTARGAIELVGEMFVEEGVANDALGRVGGGVCAMARRDHAEITPRSRGDRAEITPRSRGDMSVSTRPCRAPSLASPVYKVSAYNSVAHLCPRDPPRMRWCDGSHRVSSAGQGCHVAHCRRRAGHVEPAAAACALFGPAGMDIADGNSRGYIT